MTVYQCFKWAVLKNMGQVLEVKIDIRDLTRENVSTSDVLNEKLQRTAVRIHVVNTQGKHDVEPVWRVLASRTIECTDTKHYRCSPAFSSWLMSHQTGQKYALIPVTVLVDHRYQTVKLLGE